MTRIYTDKAFPQNVFTITNNLEGAEMLHIRCQLTIINP